MASPKGEEVEEVNMNDYCKKLESWLWKAYCQRALATSAYFTALNTYNVNNNNPMSFTQTTTTPPQNDINNPPLNNNYIGQQPQPQGQQGPQPQQNRNVPLAQWQRQPLFMFAARLGRGAVMGTPVSVGTGVVVKIAPIWKRLLAECIDFLILLLVKLFVTFTVIDSFELIDLDSIDLDSLRAEAAAGDSAQLQGLYDIAFSLTSELILLEVTHRIVVCFFEGYCLWKAGGTPGKTLLGLRVIHAEDVLPYTPQNNNNNNQQQLPPQLLWDLSGQNVIVRPGSFLTFPRAFLRSALKNLSLAFFVPLAFTLFHFDFNRTIYDIFSHSVVIEI